MIKQGLYTLRKTFPTHGTFWLMSDVGRDPAPPPAPAMTSLVRTSTWISRPGKPSLAARHGLEAAIWRRTAARLKNRHRLDSWPVSVHLAHTNRVAGHPSPGAAGPAADTLTQLAMIATVISKSLRVETDHMSHTWNNTVCTRCGPDPELYWFIRTAGPGCAKKKKTIFAAETMG